MVSAICYGFISKKLTDPATPSKYMMVEVAEGGFNAKMLMTSPEGSPSEIDLLSLAASNTYFNNLAANDKTVLTQLNNLHSVGWDIIQVISVSGGGSTRYILKKGE